MMPKQRSFISFFLIFTFFIFITPTSLYSDDIWNIPLFSQHACDWGNWCIQEMTPGELQLTANLLYLIYANGLLDGEIQRCFYPLSELTQVVRNNLFDPSNPNEALLHLKNLVNKTMHLNSMRMLYTQMLHTYLEYCNQHAGNNIDKAMQTLQSYALESLSNWAYQEHETTSTTLKELSDTIIVSSQDMCAAAHLYKELSDKKEDKPFAIFEALLGSASQVMCAIDKANNALTGATDHAMNVICLSIQIYKEHYESLRSIMISHPLDLSYTTILFDAYGVSIPNRQIFLPDADHIIDHLCEVAQLATE